MPPQITKLVMLVTALTFKSSLASDDFDTEAKKRAVTCLWFAATLAFFVLAFVICTLQTSQTKMSRSSAWTLIGFVALVIMFAPLFHDDACFLTGSNVTMSAHNFVVIGASGVGVVKYGMHFGEACVACILLAVFLDPHGRLDAGLRLHRWARNYSIAVIMQAASDALINPWIIALCPPKAKVIRGIARILSPMAVVASQGILVYISILRLSIVATPKVVTRATFLFKALMLLGIFAISVVLIGILLWPADLRWIISVLGILIFFIILLIYLCFQCQAGLGFGLAAKHAFHELHDLGHPEFKGTVNRLIVEESLLSASAVATVFYLVTTAVWYSTYSAKAGYAREISILLYMSSDAGFALVCAGLLGPGGDRLAQLRSMNALAVKRRVRHIENKLMGATRSTSGPALALAALFEGQDPENLIRIATARFRRVSWDTLCHRPEIITNASTLDGQQVASDLYGLSEHCNLGDCDAFLSHSWHDNPERKWEALCGWCENFKRLHSRSPWLWLDKLCIDQAQIQMDLACLPIFLAGCNDLLIISGLTYTSRLWCCVELFVYVQIWLADDMREAPSVMLLGANDSEQAGIIAQWRSFDAPSCRCFDERDKKRIFRIIATFPGGVQAFNDHVRKIAMKLFTSSSKTTRSFSRTSTTVSSNRLEAGIHEFNHHLKNIAPKRFRDSSRTTTSTSRTSNILEGKAPSHSTTNFEKRIRLYSL